MKEVSYKEVDLEGLNTLQVIEKANLLNQWMFDTIKPYCKGSILEIGSGIGNISQFFLKNGYQITLTDIRQNYIDILKEKFGDEPTLKGVEKIDLVHPDFDKVYAGLLQSFDTIFALNVVEHIENDLLAIANAKKLLKKDGNLIILVPAFQFLFNGFDRELEHFRRYKAKSLNRLFDKNNFQRIHTQYFNAAGIAGWFITGSLMKKKMIPEGQMGLYNKLVPLFKVADKIIFNQFGLSVITVGTNK